jgi:hypothetical protein
MEALCDRKGKKFNFASRGSKNYTNYVINVDFDYVVRDFNQTGDTYSKFGYCCTYDNFAKSKVESELDGKIIEVLDNGTLFNKKGLLIGIVLNKPVKNPVDSEKLEKYFCYNPDSKCYERTLTQIPTHVESKRDAETKSEIKLECNSVYLRNWLYENGFYVNGKKYVRYKRSAGSSRLGKCLFVDECLYPDLHVFDECGLLIEEDKEIKDLAAHESYIALTSSSIIDTINIKKENILLIDKFESIFNDKCVRVWDNDIGELEAEISDVEIKNSIWDGQSLIDSSLMGKYADKGMILLRNRWFKSCAFNTKLQHFFAENNITDVSQLNGFTLAEKIEDVLMITTPDSLKYLKFGSAANWFEDYREQFGVVKYEKPSHYFDGNLIQMSYQMLNPLQADRKQIEEFLQPTVKFMEQLRDSPLAVKYFINFADEPLTEENLEQSEDIEDSDNFEDLGDSEDSEIFENQDVIEDIKNVENSKIDSGEKISNRNDLIFRLLDVNCDFHKSRMYREFRNDLLRSFVKKVKRGNVLVQGTYATVCSNPIEMLYHSILDKDSDNRQSKFDAIEHRSLMGIGNIYCKKFKFDKALYAARNPFICNGNYWLPVNKDNALINEYMNPTDEIVFINSINENVLQRNNGMDMDSDTVALSPNTQLIELVRKNYHNFLVPVCEVSSETISRRYTKTDLAELDSRIAINKIGEIVNLSQQLNSELWHRINNDPDFDMYNDEDRLIFDIYKLAVLSGVEIDSAKKEFRISASSELDKIRQKLLQIYDERIYRYNLAKDESEQIITTIKPGFMRTITVSNGYKPNPKTLYERFDTSMDYLQSYITSEYQGFNNKGSKKSTPLLVDLLVKDLIFDDMYGNKTVKNRMENRRTILAVLKLVYDTRVNIGKIWRKKRLSKSSKMGLVRWYREQLLEDVSKIALNPATVLGLLEKSDKEHILKDEKGKKILDKNGEEIVWQDKGGLLLQTLMDIPSIDILQYFVKNDDKTQQQKRKEIDEKISELYTVYGIVR